MNTTRLILTGMAVLLLGACGSEMDEEPAIVGKWHLTAPMNEDVEYDFRSDGALEKTSYEPTTTRKWEIDGDILVLTERFPGNDHDGPKLREERSSFALRDGQVWLTAYHHVDTDSDGTETWLATLDRERGWDGEIHGWSTQSRTLELRADGTYTRTKEFNQQHDTPNTTVVAGRWGRHDEGGRTAIEFVTDGGTASTYYQSRGAMTPPTYVLSR
jgi:hypothetical protein